MKPVFICLFALYVAATMQPLQAQTNVSGTISKDSTWTLSGSPYILTGSVTVASGKTLTIQAGVNVQFRENCSLLAQGTLKASGTKNLPITFSPSGNSGNYHGPVIIDANSTNSVLQHVNITNFYVPDAALIIKSINSCKIDSCVISGTRGNAIDLQGSSPAVISHNIFSSNTGYDVVLGLDDLNKLSGNNSPLNLAITSLPMTVNAVLTAGNNYSFVNDVTVVAGKTLTINPGVSILFRENCSLLAQGTLKASGTKNLPITFSPSGNSGNYHGPVIIDANSTNSVLQHVNITNFYVPDAALIIKSINSCKIDSCVISGTRGNAIDLQGSSPAVISHNIFSSNTGYDVVLGLDDLNKLSGNNSPLNLAITSLPMTVNAVLTAGNNYSFVNDVTVVAGKTLTINPGVSILFRENCSLLAQGTLKASGTKNLPITFSPSGNSGNYHGPVIIDANSTNSVLQHVNITNFYVPDAALIIKSINSCKIDSCVISGTRGNAIDLQGSSPAVISHNIFSSNTGYDVVLGLDDLNKLSGNNSPLNLAITSLPMTVNAVLTAGNNYSFVNDVTVVAGKTLTINPGVSILFRENCSLLAQGTLKASGTKNLPITFSPSGNSGNYHGPVIIDANSTNSVLQHVNITNFYVPDAALIIKSINNCKIDSCVISGTRGNAIDLQGSSPAVISHNIFSSNTGYDVVLGLDDLNKLSGNNSPLNLAITSLPMTVNAVLTAGNNYSFVNDVTVVAGKTLTINPGVSILFRENCSLLAQGTLKASGTKNLPITFSPSGNSGNYHGPVIIDANSTNSVLQHVNITNFYVPDAALIIKSINNCKIDSCVISGTRGKGIDLLNTSSIISNNSFSNNSSGDVIASAFSLKGISGNNNASIYVTPNVIDQDVNWSNPGATSRYILTGNITVNESKRLTINAGTLVDFNSNNGNLLIKGSLNAIGTKSDKIKLVKTGAGLYGGSISFDSVSRGSLIYVSIDRLGSVTLPAKGAALELKSKYAITIRNIAIANSEQTGLTIRKGSPTILQSSFINNKTGVLSVAGKAKFVKCNFTGNSLYGINNTSTLNSEIVDARGCWWDDPTGPHQDSTNPAGLGDPVSLKVLYKPFSTKPFDPNDIGITSILSPASSCGLTSAEPVKVTIKNYGTEEQTGFTISYQVNNAPVVMENVGSLKIATDSTANFTFSTLANLSVPGRRYTIKVFTAMAGDTFLSNDTAISVINNRTPALGKDTAVKICKEGFFNLWTLYDTSGYAIHKWSSSHADSVGVGTYNLIVANNSGCLDTATARITAYNLPTPTIAASGNTTFCKGGNVTLTASPAPMYLWSAGANSQNIIVTQSGSYSVTTTNDAGCHATSAATVVQVNETPKPTITASGSLNLCPGKSVTLTSSLQDAYAWSTNDITQSIIVNTAGFYTVTVKGLNGCRSTSDSSMVTVAPCSEPTNPTASLISDSSAKLSWTSVGCAESYSLQYRKAGTTTWTTISITGNSYTVAGLTPGTSYEWAVSSICQSAPLIQSPYTNIANFTTSTSFVSRSASKEKPGNTVKTLTALVYPVPVTGNIANLNITNSNGDVTVTILDMSGKLLWTRKHVADGKIPVPVSGIAAGTYIVNVFSGKENVTIKIVRQ